MPDQLPLELDDTHGVVTTDTRPSGWAPMLPGEGRAPFDDERWFFEPWWPGVAATLVVGAGGAGSGGAGSGGAGAGGAGRAGAGGAGRVGVGRLLLVADQLTDPLPAFPDLGGVTDHVRARQAVIPGTLLVLDADGRPDAAALRRRLADPDDRVGTGAFIAADLLSRDGLSLVDLPFAARRTALLEVVVDGDRFLASRGLHGEGMTLAAAAASMGVDGVSARRLDAPWRSGVAADAWLRLPASGMALGPVRPLLVLLQRLPLD